MFAFCFTIATLANADSIVGVVGAASVGNDTYSLSFSGGNFSGYSVSPVGPVFLGSGTFGVPKTFDFGVIAWQGEWYAGAQIGAFYTDILRGGIGFTANLNVPTSALFTGSFTAPITVGGYLEAFQDLTRGQGYFTDGPLLGSLQFAGAGTGTFTIQDAGANDYVILFADATFSGTGVESTVVPEPMSLLLVGSGLSALALKVMRRSKLVP
jgi:hypothetical protein